MKKRTAVTGIVAIGIAIGLYLSGMFKGLGTGQPGDGGRQSVATNGKPADDETYEDSVASVTTETSTRVPAEPHAVLEVIVAGEGYELRGGGGTPEPVELDRLVQLAKDSPGNDTGIRVRVFKRKSSLPPAEIALKDALEQAGLPEKSVFWEEELLD